MRKLNGLTLDIALRARPHRALRAETMDMREPPLFGCIEAGGTKFVLGIGTGPHDIRATARIPTTSPAETLEAAIAWFRAQPPLAALGIASFGPVDLDPASPRWGYITATTKPGWDDTNMAGAFGRALDLPVGFDTDVNGAILGEHRWGAAQGCDVAVYITVGTGIGGGAMVGGRPVHGRGHPEMGHVRPARHPDDSDFAGICPFHGDCFEGLASGPAIQARWGASLSELAPDHPAHAITAWYLGQLCVTLQAVLAPQRIILGGGVMATPGLIARVRDAAARASGGYFGTGSDAVIVPPGLGDRSGLLGALALAERAYM